MLGVGSLGVCILPRVDVLGWDVRRTRGHGVLRSMAPGFGVRGLLCGLKQTVSGLLYRPESRVVREKDWVLSPAHTCQRSMQKSI
jgi:hypothetical protein